MDSEDKKVAWIVGLLLSFVVAMATVIAFWHTCIVKTYVSKGYTRTTLAGSEYTHWVKDANN